MFVEPPGGCPVAGAGPPRDFVFGALDGLAVAGGQVDLGAVSCAGGGLSTTDEVVGHRHVANFVERCHEAA